MCALADLVAREIAPLFLEHDDGRPCFPGEGQTLRAMAPLTGKASALEASEIIRAVSRRVNAERDGAMAPILMQAFWLAIASAAVEDGQAVEGDYGAHGISDLGAEIGLAIPEPLLRRLMELCP